MNKQRNTSDTPMDRLVSEVVRAVISMSSEVVPYHSDRPLWAALRAAEVLGYGHGRAILRTILAYEMSSQGDADQLDDLAEAMRANAEAWAVEAEQGAASLRDPLNRRTHD